MHAIFYNFADGEVARDIPRVWAATTPEAALRRILGKVADGPGLARARR